ncbi:MAG: hotdog fold thioesterase [Nannocystaceae bacterium]
MTDAIDPEELRRYFEERIPYNKHLGIKVEAIGPRRCVLRLPFRPEFIGDTMRPAIHGGITSALADAAGGMVCYLALRTTKDRLSTIDLRVDYLRPGRPEDLLCEARIVRVGNRLGVARMQLFSGALPPEDLTEDARLAQAIATALAVYNVIRRGE